MLIEIRAVANVSSQYQVDHLLRIAEAHGVEWKLTDQLTEHGMSLCCHLTWDGLGSLRGVAPEGYSPHVGWMIIVVVSIVFFFF